MCFMKKYNAYDLLSLLKEKKVDLKLLDICGGVDMYNSSYKTKHYCRNRNEGKLSEDEFLIIKEWLDGYKEIKDCDC